MNLYRIRTLLLGLWLSWEWWKTDQQVWWDLGPVTGYEIFFFCFFFFAQRKTDQRVCKDLGPVPRTTCLLFELLLVVTNFSASWMTRFVLMSCFLIFLVCWLSFFARLVFSWWRRTRSLFVFERGMARLLSTARQFWQSRRASRPCKSRKKRDGRERAMEQSGRMRTQMTNEMKQKIGQWEWENW